MVGAEAGSGHVSAGICAERRDSCDDERVTKLWRMCVSIALIGTVVAAAPMSASVAATAPPVTSTSQDEAPPVTNDLLPGNNSLDNCVGTVEQPNCGSRARADGHTYLVFLALAAGLAFIGWRITRGVRRRDESQRPTA
jgi:hypothetical protein